MPVLEPRGGQRPGEPVQRHPAEHVRVLEDHGELVVVRELEAGHLPIDAERDDGQQQADQGGPTGFEKTLQATGFHFRRIISFSATRLQAWRRPFKSRILKAETQRTRRFAEKKKRRAARRLPNIYAHLRALCVKALGRKHQYKRKAALCGRLS